jgi:hypothetical protein
MNLLDEKESNYYSFLFFDLFLNYIYCYFSLFLCDKVLNYNGINDSKTRWFFIHFIANMYISYYTLPDVFLSFIDSDISLLRPIEMGPIDYSNAIMIGSIHIFHMVHYYKDLTNADLFHHLLFVPFNQICFFWPVLFQWEKYRWGTIINTINFFSCGLPGGVDYFLLGLCKINRLCKLKHKKWQSFLNVWIRSPGIIMGITICLTECLRNWYKLTLAGKIIPFLCFFLIGFNALHYMERVVLSTGRNIQDYRGVS